MRGQHTRVRPATRARSFLLGERAHQRTAGHASCRATSRSQAPKSFAAAPPPVPRSITSPGLRPGALIGCSPYGGAAAKQGAWEDGERDGVVPLSGPTVVWGRREVNLRRSHSSQSASGSACTSAAKGRPKVGFRHEVTSYDETGTRQHGASGAQTSLGAKRARAAVRVESDRAGPGWEPGR